MEGGDVAGTFLKHEGRKKPKGRKQTKKSAYERLSTAVRLTGSTILADDVDLLFKPEFLNIPGKTKEVGSKIVGSTVNEVLDAMLDQLRPAGISISNAEELNKIYLDRFPMTKQIALQEIIKLLDVVFKELEIDGKEAAEQMELFKQASSNLRRYRDECESSPKEFESLVIRNMLEELIDELAGSHPWITCPHKSSLHKALAAYWLHLLLGILAVEVKVKSTTTGSNSDKDADLQIKEIMFRESGACLFEFAMEVSDDFLVGLGKDMDEKQNSQISVKHDAKGDVSSSDEYRKKTCQKKTIVAQPGLSGFLRTHFHGQAEDETKKVFFVAEFKGSLKTINPERAESESSQTSTSEISGTEQRPGTSNSHDDNTSSENAVQSAIKRKSLRQSEGPQKKMKSASPEDKDEQVLTSGIHTQHFLELLCAMKFQNSGDILSLIHKCFGMYCVDHRFYITCLAAVPKSDKKSVGSDQDVVAARRHFISGCTTPENFRDNKRMKLRMVCTDYLDMTNSVHMEAMLKFIAVLGTYEA